MTEYKELLKTLIKLNGVERIDKNTDLDFDIAKQLFDRGFIEAELDDTYGGPGLINPKASLAGQQWLKEQDSEIPWWKSFDKRIAVLGVVVAVIALYISIR